MKKLKQAGFVLLAVLFTAVFCGCAEDRDNVPRSAQGGDMANYPYELGRFEGLEAETEWQILLDYFNTYLTYEHDRWGTTVNDIYISHYYGVYKGCVLFHMDGPWEYMTVEVCFVLDDISFPYPITLGPDVWKDGDLYRLHEAYNSGLLTLDDIRSIAAYFNNGGEE